MAKRRPKIAPVLASALLLAACLPGETRVESPTSRTVVGRLQGTASGPDRCAWLADSNGNRVSVFFPSGYEIEFFPLRLRDATGAVVAREGDTLQATGFEVGGAEGAACQPSDWLAADTIVRLPG